MATAETGKFRLQVPLDASQVGDLKLGSKADLKPDLKLKLGLLAPGGKLVATQVVALDSKGKGSASFAFDKAPGALRLALVPADTLDEDIARLDTLIIRIDPKRWLKPELVLKPVLISTLWWRRWWRWCRTFTVSGRVLCADGRPVPGAKVCAFDIDSWWWWSSFQQVGCSTTNADGEFEMSFRWCCGWLPIWWWRLRDWRLDLDLAERLQELVKPLPEFKLPRPQPQPDPMIFERLVEPGPGPRPAPQVGGRVLPRGDLAFEGARINALREQLVARLPKPQDAMLLQLWPWAPFAPWNDCTPDIAFRVTQACQGEERLIVNEPWWRARWNIDTQTEVTLVANDEACCARDVPDPPENCAVPFSVCGALSLDIGGNLGAPPAPVGYANPMDLTVNADAPWAGSLVIGGDVGCDYYAFEVALSGAGPWTPVSPLTAGGFNRVYWDVPSASFQTAAFPFQTLSGRLVCESRMHYENRTFPGDWGTGSNHIWLGSNFDALMVWHTANHYNNGRHHLRLLGFDETAGNLSNARVLKVCGTDADNGLVLALDNRLPATLGREPRADVLQVRIGGIEAGPCSNVQVKATDDLQIDFIAYDIDGHLSEYALAATYGKNLAVNLLGLLGLPGVTLTPMPLDGEPGALQVGPSYPVALAQGAARPTWAGGGLRLTVPAAHLRNAFPVTCCYQIELHVLKRTIDSCNGSRPHRAFSFYSLTVNV